MSNLFAYTPFTYEGEQPPYVSLNRVGIDLVLTVRSAGSPQEPQNIGTITLPGDAASGLARALLSPVNCVDAMNCGWRHVPTVPEIGLHLCCRFGCPHTTSSALPTQSGAGK